jgi:hypothetical protein
MTSPDTQRVDVARLAELLAKATPTKWEVCARGFGDADLWFAGVLSDPAVSEAWNDYDKGLTRGTLLDADAELFAEAVNALPALLLQVAEERELRMALEVAWSSQHDRAEAAERAREEVRQWVCHNGGLLNEWAKEWNPARDGALTDFIGRCLDAAFLAANGTSHDEGGEDHE